MKSGSLLPGALLSGGLQFVIAICFFRYIRSLGSSWWGEGFSFDDLITCLFAGGAGVVIGIAASKTRRPMLGAIVGLGGSMVAYGAMCLPYSFVASISHNASGGEVNHLVNGTIAMVVAGMFAGGIGAALAKRKQDDPPAA